MIRINDTELNARGYVSTEGIMSIEFETESSLDEIAKLFSKAKNVEVFDNYSVKNIDNILIQGDNPRRISVQMTIGGVMEEASMTTNASEVDNTVQPTKEPETLEEYVEAVSSGQIVLSDVPSDIRDNVAIKLGV